MEEKEEARRRKKEIVCEHSVRPDWVEREKAECEEKRRLALERRIAARANAGQGCRKRAKERAQQIPEEAAQEWQRSVRRRVDDREQPSSEG